MLLIQCKNKQCDIYVQEMMIEMLFILPNVSY